MPKNSLIFFLLFLWIVPDLSGKTLIAYYPFDNHTADLSGNNNDGYFYGGLKTTTDRFGNPCGALYFNGKDAFIQVPNSVSLKSPVKAITVTCWFKLDSPSLLKDKKWLTLVCKGKDFEESYLNPQYRVQVYQSPIQSTISINTDFTEYDSNFVKNSFPTGWNFFALVYDGKYVRTFLNKVQIWEFAYTKTFSPNDDPLFIGRDIPGNMEFFAGALDDLRIFNGALTGTEITNIYQKDIPAVSKKDPEILCPADITVNNDPGTCFAKVNFNKAAVDYDCGNLTVKQTEGLPSGSNFQIGESKLIFEIKNKNGVAKTCTTKIIVMDKEPPAFRCKEDTFILRTDSSVIGFYYT